MKKLKYLKTIEDINYYLFKPSLFLRYYPCYTEDETPPYFSRIIHKIRMTRELFKSKYQIVYMEKEGNIIGHLVVGRGGSRIEMSTKNDIVIGPIWIVPQKRSCGYGSKGIDFVLNVMEINYEYVFEYIDADNVASIRTVEKNGFDSLGLFKEYGLFKIIKPCDDGNIKVFRKRNNLMGSV